MTIIKTNSYHLLITYVSGTVLYTLHINLMKYSYYPHFMRRKLRRVKTGEVPQGHASPKAQSWGTNPGRPHLKSVHVSQ